MSSQLSNLIFFHLLYAFYHTLDKQVGNCYKLGNLVDEVNNTICVWFYSKNGSNYLHLMMPEFFLDQLAVSTFLESFKFHT